jgi:leucyl aminopeptidase
MINERAMVPGDVLVASNGKTIEVGNTDAEGRLTMADALVYVDKELECERIIELSTLTGSCMISLGKAMAGLWTNDDQLANELEEASRVTGEKLWRMPLAEEYKEQLRSKIADIKNIGTRYGGAITAALFLQNFVESKPFAHIDIAGEGYALAYWILLLSLTLALTFLFLVYLLWFCIGPVWSDKVGATGYGAKLVTEWVCRQGGKGDEET